LADSGIPRGVLAEVGTLPTYWLQLGRVRVSSIAGAHFFHGENEGATTYTNYQIS